VPWSFNIISQPIRICIAPQQQKLGAETVRISSLNVFAIIPANIRRITTHNKSKGENRGLDRLKAKLAMAELRQRAELSQSKWHH
jgi:hypothetical protein